MIDREYDTRLLEKRRKIDEMFEGFRIEKAGSRADGSRILRPEGQMGTNDLQGRGDIPMEERAGL
jgi:hypothetical protein